jgi:hypothetical protein
MMDLYKTLGREVLYLNKWVQRAKHVLKGENGASNIEIIIWISVVLVIATALFLFRGDIVNFLSNASGQVANLKTS